jgi:hypothetical protein
MGMQGWLCKAACAVVAPLCLAGPASAATIDYQVNNLGGSSWEYSYTITNDTLSAALEEFTIFFAVGLYENLAVTASATDWDSLVVQPDTGLPDDGYFDALAEAAGIPVSGSLGGFKVSFDFLGAGTPGAQPFDIVDPATTGVLESGTTTVVPAPAAGWLLGTGVLALVAGRRRLRARISGLN